MFADANEEKTRDEILAETPDAIRSQAESNLDDPQLISRIHDAFIIMGIAGEESLAVTLYLVGTSRLLKGPLAAIVQGPSSSGKSFLIDQVTSLFPEEEVIQATDMTANALYYMPPGKLKHRFVVLGERKRRQNDDTATGTKALREMISSGKLSKSAPMANSITGELETRLISQEGPIAYLESTTLTKIFEEDANRCLLLQTDERPDQTARIIDSLAAKAEGRVAAAEQSRTTDVFQTMQRLLEPYDVIIPFAGRLGALFPKQPIEVRRGFDQVLGVIRASAILHQRQRQVENGRLWATAEDYKLARDVISDSIARSLGGEILPAVRRFHEELQQLGDGKFTAGQAARRLRRSERTVRDYLKILQELDAVEQSEAGRGPIAAKWSVRHDVHLAATMDNVLPPVDEVCEMSEMPAEIGPADLSDVPF